MYIKSKRVFVENRFVPATIAISNEKIAGIFPYDKTGKDTVDYGDLRIVPGFYDIHCHGYGGYDTDDGTADGLKKWLSAIPSERVCGLCPTTITQSHEVLSVALRNVAAVKKSQPTGAEILGIHLEGPYISKVFKGAQPEEYIVKPNIEEFKGFQNDAEGLIKIITIAPEEDEGLKLTRYCADHGVNVSLGHSAATFEQAQAAFAAGACGFTHTYNGMSRFGHRENNLVGAALGFDGFAECICDGHHSTYNALKIFFKCKGKDGIMVSDGLQTKGLPIGTKMLFGGQMTEVIADGTCRLVSTGNFAGSTMKTNEGLRNLAEYSDVPFEIALAACTSAPARYLRIDDHKGYIRKGYDADIVVLKDDYDIAATYCRGIRYAYE